MSEPRPSTLPPRNPDVDGFLVLWVHLANQNDTQLSITLQMHGLIVSGTLISYREYSTRLTDLLNRYALAERQPQVWEGAFSRLASVDPPEQLPSFIHLANVALVSIDGMEMPDQRIVWRGRLSEVDAWWIGHTQGGA